MVNFKNCVFLLRLDVMYPEKYKKVVFSIFFIRYV